MQRFRGLALSSVWKYAKIGRSRRRYWLTTLQIAGKDVHRYSIMLVGVQFVAREIHFYTRFEGTYLTRPSKFADQLGDTLVETYENLLGFLAKAYKYYSKRTIGTTLDLSFSSHC
jgi:hypothetical protein